MHRSTILAARLLPAARQIVILLPRHLQQGQDGRADPLNPKFHKEFSSLIYSGEQGPAVPLGRVFLC
jgi:hypothetical protein